MTPRIQSLIPEILTKYTSGASPDSIAKLTGINVKTVYNVLYRSDIEIRKQRKNIIGIRFGRLMVIKFVGKDGNGKLLWECKCDCGNVTTVRGNDLRQKKIQSCGCILRETSKINIKNAHLKYPNTYGFTGIGDIPGQHIGQIRNSAYLRGIEYTLTKEYLWELFQKQHGKCSLTGLPLHFRSRKGGKNVSPTASLDRIDSTIGYVEGNVQWVHKDINNMKNCYSLDTFIEYCHLVSDNNPRTTI